MRSLLANLARQVPPPDTRCCWLFYAISCRRRKQIKKFLSKPTRASVLLDLRQIFRARIDEAIYRLALFKLILTTTNPPLSGSKATSSEGFVDLPDKRVATRKKGLDWRINYVQSLWRWIFWLPWRYSPTWKNSRKGKENFLSSYRKGRKKSLFALSTASERKIPTDLLTSGSAFRAWVIALVML